MSIDAMKLALEALELYQSKGSVQMFDDAAKALRERLAQSETELETYKRLYELRGRALERPCSNCGHQPAKIKTMAQPEQEPTVKQSLTVQPEQELVCVCGAIWEGQELVSTPPQRKPLTNEQLKQIVAENVDGVTVAESVMFRMVARAIEAAHGIKGEA